MMTYSTDINTLTYTPTTSTNIHLSWSYANDNPFFFGINENFLCSRFPRRSRNRSWGEKKILGTAGGKFFEA